jgi:hypothetical protein
MKEQNIERAVEFLQECLRNIVQEKYPLDKLIITKSLRSTYKNPQQIAHKVLADRMGKRDPGNKPGSGDRIPFVYVETQGKVSLQGDKIEHPAYIIENKLKPNYEFYITNQIMKPVQQVFELVLDEIHCFQPCKDEFNNMVSKVLEIMPEDEEKREKKRVDLRNRQVKILLFDEFLNEQTKPLRGQTKKNTTPKKKTVSKMKLLKEENDGSISEVKCDEEPIKKKRGRPRKINIVKEEELTTLLNAPNSTNSNISDLTDLTDFSDSTSLLEQVINIESKVEPVKRPRGRPKKMKIIVEE